MEKYTNDELYHGQYTIHLASTLESINDACKKLIKKCKDMGPHGNKIGFDTEGNIKSNKLLVKLLNSSDSDSDCENEILIYEKNNSSNNNNNPGVDLIQFSSPDGKDIYLLFIMEAIEKGFEYTIESHDKKMETPSPKSIKDSDIIPIHLKKILESHTILKCGVDALTDARRIKKCLGIKMEGVLDVQLFAKASNFNRYNIDYLAELYCRNDSKYKLNTFNNYNQLGSPLTKGEDVIWRSNIISEELIRYAAEDCYKSYLITMGMTNRISSQFPDETKIITDKDLQISSSNVDLNDLISKLMDHQSAEMKKRWDARLPLRLSSLSKIIGNYLNQFTPTAIKVIIHKLIDLDVIHQINMSPGYVILHPNERYKVAPFDDITFVKTDLLKFTSVSLPKSQNAILNWMKSRYLVNDPYIIKGTKEHEKRIEELYKRIKL